MYKNREATSVFTSVLPQDADEGQVPVDLSQEQNRAGVELDKGRRLLVKCSVISYTGGVAQKTKYVWLTKSFSVLR